MIRINCYLPIHNYESAAKLISELQANAVIQNIYLPEETATKAGGKAKPFSYNGFGSTQWVKALAATVTGVDYVLVLTKNTALSFGQFAVERMVSVAEATNAAKVYSDYYEIKEGQLSAHPVIDYQEGSLRDDFNFGPLVLYRADALKKSVENMVMDFENAGLYYLRLKMSQQGAFVRIPEFLYTIDETDLRKSGQKLFDYVDPKNRKVQIEMEQAVTEHLKDVRAWLAPETGALEFDDSAFDKKASVVIPVRNREKTIADAIESVLAQKTSFAFNLIIVDNHSTDKTSEIIRSFAEKDNRINPHHSCAK